MLEDVVVAEDRLAAEERDQHRGQRQRERDRREDDGLAPTAPAGASARR